MKIDHRSELSGGGSFTRTAQNTGWAPRIPYATVDGKPGSKEMVRRGGADQSPMYRAQHHYVDRLEASLGHLGSSPTDESHLVDNDAIDWNRHMDRAEIPDEVRDQYGPDIVNAVIHRRRMQFRGLRQFTNKEGKTQGLALDTGPRDDEDFNNTFNY